MENKLVEFKYNGIKLSFEISKENRIFLVYAGEEKGEKIIDENLTQFANIVECEYIGGTTNGPLGTRNNFSSYGKTYKYVSHESKENKLGLEVVIKTRNELLEIDTHYQIYKTSKSISCFNIVKNISGKDVKLTSISSFYQYGLLKANNLDNHLYIANNSWHREAQWQKFNFVDLGIYNGNEHASMGCYTLSNTGGWSTKDHLPMIVIENKEEAILAQIENNGSWNFEIQDYGNYVYLFAGGPTLTNNFWKKIVKPGSEFESVHVTISYGKDFEDVIQEITKARRAMRRPNKDDEELPVIFNDYMHALWDTQTTKLIKPLVDVATELGCDEFCIDAGWYAVGKDWWNILGNWKEEPKNFPDGGLVALCDYIRSKGLKVGIWVEIEAVGIHSPVLKWMPESWFFQVDGVPVVHRERYQLNFANLEVYKYAVGVIDELCEKYNIDYLKIDYNSDPGVGNDYMSDSLGDGLLEHNRAFIRFLKEIMDKHPNLTVENCGSGGCRMDYEILKYCPIQSTSDQTNYRKYPYLAANVATAATPEQAAVWAYPLNDYEKIMPTDEVVVMNMCNAMLGRIHLSSYINTLPENQKDLVREGLAYYRSINDFKKHSLPIFPRGTARFFDPEVVGGLETSDKLVLGVWNTSGKARNIKVNLSKYDVKDMKVGYPTSLPTNFKFDKSSKVLEVNFDAEYGGRIFEFTK